MPEMIIGRPTSVLVTATGSLTSPWIRVRFSCGVDRADRREVSFDGVRTTGDVISRQDMFPGPRKTRVMKKTHVQSRNSQLQVTVSVPPVRSRQLRQRKQVRVWSPWLYVLENSETLSKAVRVWFCTQCDSSGRVTSYRCSNYNTPVTYIQYFVPLWAMIPPRASKHESFFHPAWG